MVLDSFLGEFRISFTQQLVVDADAVVGEGFSVAIVDALADLQKLEIVVDSFTMLFDVVIEHADGVV
jgi:hypothetical protein